MTTLQITPGDIVTRAELKEMVGGSTQGGIIPSRSSPNILLFTDHESAQRYGYQDGWLAEEDEFGPVFEYTGEGNYGDQSLSGKNGSVLRHREEGRSLHLFMAEGLVEGTGTKTHRYIGQFVVDEREPYVERLAPDTERATRWVFVFRLRPASEVSQDPSDYVPPADQTDVKEVSAAQRTPAEASTSTPTTPESNSGQPITRRPSAPVEVKRHEAELSDRFRTFLEQQGHKVIRYDIRVKGLTSILYTDLYDATANVLYEAKGKSTRDSVRQAIGQLFDYRRRLPNKEARLAVLLPEQPHEDLIDLIDSVGMALVYNDGESFVGWPVSA